MLVTPGFWAFQLRRAWAYWRDNGAVRSRLGTLGEGASIEETALTKYPENVHLGQRSHINHYCCVWASPNATITIGDDGLMGPGVKMFCSDHGFAAGEVMHEQPYIEKDIRIGADVWLGANCVITAGVTIGDGTLVAAGSVVTRDLPGNSICAGVPAKVLRQRS